MRRRIGVRVDLGNGAFFIVAAAAEKQFAFIKRHCCVLMRNCVSPSPSWRRFYTVICHNLVLVEKKCKTANQNDMPSSIGPFFL